MITRRPLLLGFLVLLVAVGGGLAAWPSLADRIVGTFGRARTPEQSQGSLETLGAYGEVPDFTLTERSGRRVTREDLLGKVWIANFFYTECTDTCSLQSAKMARLQTDFGEAPDVRLVSISVDPEHDTTEILSEYARRFQADPQRWLFLTGSKDAIYRLAIEGFRLGVVDQGEKAQRGPDQNWAWPGPAPAWAHPVPNPDRKPIIHSSRFVLVDHRAKIRAYHLPEDEQSLERLRANTGILLRETRKGT